VPNRGGMPGHDPRDRAISWLDRREQEKGLRPRYAAYIIVALWLAAIVIWGVAEHLIDEDTFPTVWLGMWWALQTVTTVGYGDVVPASDAGRAVATLLLLGGLAFLSVVTAVITSSFVARRQQEIHAEGNDPIIERLDSLNERLDAIEVALRGSDRPAG
jgi:voltage-gated potassium channel